MILLIDNYDSFVFNLARYVRELQEDVSVVRNDAITVDQIREIKPAGIIMSPGPCTPNEAGICQELVRRLSGEIPLLGVCLGHQAIVSALGGIVGRSPRPMHGQSAEVEHDNSTLFAGMPNPFRAGRYHSLLADESRLPAELLITARTSVDRLIMGIAHRDHLTFGVQFHPESILTEQGHRILGNFLKACGLKVPEYIARELNEPAKPDGPESGSMLDPKPAFW